MRITTFYLPRLSKTEPPSLVRIDLAGGALVGAALLGPVGLLAGAVTGKKVTRGKVKNVELHIVVDDAAAPSFLLCLLSSETDKSDPRYRTALEWARAWQNRLELLIRKADRENHAGVPLRDNRLHLRRNLATGRTKERRRAY